MKAVREISILIRYYWRFLVTGLWPDPINNPECHAAACQSGGVSIRSSDNTVPVLRARAALAKLICEIGTVGHPPRGQAYAPILKVERKPDRLEGWILSDIPKRFFCKRRYMK